MKGLKWPAACHSQKAGTRGNKEFAVGRQSLKKRVSPRAA